MIDQFAFRCPHCNVRLRVSASFLGRSCNCPKCSNAVTVQLPALDDELPVLVADEGHRGQGRYALNSY